MSKAFFEYLDDGMSFRSQAALNYRTIYAPLCGPDAASIKSSITPHLSGDIKIDKHRYLTKPMSTQDLREDVRNLFVHIKGKGVVSFTDHRFDEDSFVEVKPLWHKLTHNYKDFGVSLSALNFVPVSGEHVEVMYVTVTNTSNETLTITPTGVVPLFARSLANKHDHEHVTSLLHRIEQVPQGVLVSPTMKFNEEGHLPNEERYFVYGCEGAGHLPKGSFPTMTCFLGDSGTRHYPEAVFNNIEPKDLTAERLHGKEAFGALRFETCDLAPGEAKEFILVAGIAEANNSPQEMFEAFNSPEKIADALAHCRDFWRDKARSIVFQTGDDEYNAWMQWVTLQPVLRRIYGCSFLPDHDYGKGGKGWRDLWQDLLSLILIEPQEVRDSLLNNFAGIRIDGSNATIIGEKPGEFLADRNAITRVWMDHGAWPLPTTLLYIHQTGDMDFLWEKVKYFRDPQLSRTYKKDEKWTSAYGNYLRTKSGDIYEGSVLEHLLLQNVVQFFNVGEHNIIRLESADWNDGLDMAFDKGESVAFTCFYGGNLLELANLLEELDKRGINNITLAKEMLTLFDTLSEAIDYDDAQAKRNCLFEQYCNAVQPELSGETMDVATKDLIQDLRKKGEWVFHHVRQQEKISIKEGKATFEWFNGYYDNQANRVEGKQDDHVRMTLTGQVFPLMSGLANDKEAQHIIDSVNQFLKDPALGGYRLNSDFGVRHYLDLGRAFGFAFGTKENGAFFSHMIVMYAYGLYHQGFAREGYNVLKSIYNMCMDSKLAKIYPGVPEYFDSEGRGMYHYLTGSASWLVLTQLNQAFGVKGFNGDLFLKPQLVKEQFNVQGEAQVSCQFASHKVIIQYANPQHLDARQYRVASVTMNNQNVDWTSHENGAIISRQIFDQNHPGGIVLQVSLEK